MRMRDRGSPPPLSYTLLEARKKEKEVPPPSLSYTLLEAGKWKKGVLPLSYTLLEVGKWEKRVPSPLSYTLNEQRKKAKRVMNGLMLFPFRFFLLCSGSLAYAGHALIVDLAALLRVVVQGRLQALADDV